MKQRLIEFLIMLAMAASLLGGYHVYARIKAHNEMDRALISLIEKQGKAAQQ